VFVCLTCIIKTAVPKTYKDNRSKVLLLLLLLSSSLSSLSSRSSRRCAKNVAGGEMKVPQPSEEEIAWDVQLLTETSEDVNWIRVGVLVVKLLCI
jgi:hypothetical protein